MSDITIKVGDIVDVHFNNIDSIFNAKILYTPCATGDCFKVVDEYGNIYNVQQYNYMVKKIMSDKNKFNEFYKAWWFLNECKIFEDKYEVNWFNQSLCIEVVKVNPKTSMIDDNMELNTKVQIWLECGEPYYDENFKKILTCHNPEYDCGGGTFEEAIINLANIVYEKNEQKLKE